MALTKVGPAGIGSTPGTGYVIGDSFLHATGLNATNAYYTGIVTAQTFRVLGNFQVDGTTTTLDTEVTSVDKLEVAANNTTVGVAITQSGSGDILNLYDGSSEVFSVADGGGVTITDSIIHSGDTNTKIRFPADDTFTVETNGAERLRITSGRNIGIGLTNPAHNLDVYLSGRLNQLGQGGYGLLVGPGSTYGGFTYKSTGDIEISTAQTTKDIVFSDAIGGNERMRLTGDTGRLGIGQANPQSKLQIENDGEQLRLTYPSIASYIHEVKSNGDYAIDKDGTERLRVTSAGLVGINTTAPQSRLEVFTNDDTDFGDSSNTNNTNSLIRLFNKNGTDNTAVNNYVGIRFDVANGATSSAWLSYVRTGNNTGAFQFKARNAASSYPELMRIDSAGRMGLGVVPSNFGTNRTALEIHSPSATVTHLALTNSTTGSNGASNGFNIIQNGNNALLYLRENANMTFSTNNVERIHIASNGQVLVGNYATHSAINGNLEVNGNDGINISNATRTGTNGAQWRLIPHNGGGSATNLRLYEGAGSVEVLNVTKTGRIGVNRLTPSFMLDIVGNSSTGANCIRITDGAETGHGSHPAKIVAGGTYYHEMQMHSRRFTVHTYDGSSIAERFRVHQTGQVILGTQSPLNSLPGIQMYLGGGDPSIVGCKADNNPAAYVTLLKLAGYSQSSSSFRENAAILFETNTANNSGNASGRILFRTEGLNETNGPSTRAVITAEGKMGIGIEDPSGILDIKSTQTSSLKTFLRLGDSGNGGSYFDFNMSDQSSGADEINHRKDGYVPKDTYGLKISSHSTLNGSYTQAGPASIRWYFPSAGGGNQAGGQLEFWTNQNGYAGTSETKKMQIDNYGNIGAPSGNNIYNASDERLKENIVNLTGCLEKVKQLRPISFTWKDGFGMMSGVSEYGFGAQTTQAVDEILVEPFGEDDIVLDEETIENPLRVNDKYIVPMLVKAVQEQQEQIEALQALVNSLTS